MQEEAFVKQSNNDDSEQNIPVSHELTQDKVKWLQEEAFKGKNGNGLMEKKEGNNDVDAAVDETNNDMDGQLNDTLDDENDDDDEDGIDDDDDDEDRLENNDSKPASTNADLYALLNATKARLAAIQEKYLSKDTNQTDDQTSPMTNQKIRKQQQLKDNKNYGPCSIILRYDRLWVLLLLHPRKRH